MTEKITTSGLCMNCSNFVECNYGMNLTQPIIFCEEYICADQSESKNNIDGRINMTDYPIGQISKGICSNCENLEMCTLQKADYTLNLRRSKIISITRPIGVFACYLSQNMQQLLP